MLRPYQGKVTDVANSKNMRTTYRCSFCGKSQDQVQRLIAGPGGVYICDECIDLCREIIEEEQATVTKPRLQTGKRSEEHTSELQSQSNLVCRLLLDKTTNDPDPTRTFALRAA